MCHRRPASAVTLAALSTLALLVSACGDDTPPETEKVACDPTRRPIVMAHGFLASGDTYAAFARRFEANGYCQSHLVAFDWNTLAFDRESAVTELDQAIDATLAATGADQVDLVGHSAGGGLGYAYLNDPARAAKVAAYAHIASNPNPLQAESPGPAGPAEAPVATLNLTSAGDLVVDGGEIPGAINIVLPTEDHYEAATSARAFADVYAFFNGGERPKVTTLPESSSNERVISGRALTLGENKPVPGFIVSLYEVDPDTGLRRSETPVATSTVTETGRYGPFTVKADTHYELHLEDPTGVGRDVHYFREPFAPDTHLVYLRALPGPESLAGVLISLIPFDDRHAVLIAFSSSQGVIHGRDTLTLNGETLSTPELASAERTSIAFFAFDDGSDQQSAGLVPSFSNAIQVFLTAIDRYFPADKGPLTLTLNGRTLTVPALPSSTDGAIVATFD